MAVKKDLKYFMRSSEPEIVTAPGPETFKDDEGNVSSLRLKSSHRRKLPVSTTHIAAVELQPTKRAIPLWQTARLFGKPKRTQREPAAI